MAFLNDTLTDTNGTNLQNHTGETGATWTSHPSYQASAKIQSNRLHGNNGTRGYYASGTPASADYDVEGVLRRISSTGNGGLAGRMDTTANTMYLVTWEASGGGQFALYKIVNGSIAPNLGTFADTSTGTDRIVKLQMRGSAIKVFIDGVEQISATDTDITAAGRAGVRLLNGTSTTGTHIDSVTASDAGSALTKSIDDSISVTDAVAKSAAKSQADSLSGTDQLSRAWDAARSVADGLSVTDAVGKAVAFPLADQASVTDARASQVGKSEQDSIAATDDQAKDVAHTEADDLTVTDARELAFGKLVEDTAALTDDATPDLSSGAQNHTLDLSDGITVGDQLARQWAAVRAVSDSASVADAAGKAVGRAEADAVSASDAVAKAPGLRLGETVALADSLGRTWSVFRAFSDAVSITDEFTSLSPLDEWTYGPYSGWTFDGSAGWSYGGTAAASYNAGTVWSYGGTDGWSYSEEDFHATVH